MQKNVSGQSLLVFAFNRSTGAPVLGDAANITCKVSLNNGTATPLTDVNPVETEDGRYLFDVTQAETNADTIDPYPESSTSGVQVVVLYHDRQTLIRGVTAPGSGPTSVPYGDPAMSGGALRNFASMAQVQVFTLHDLVHRLSLRASASSSPRMNALFARAIQDAIRGLPGKNNWKYFKRQTRLNTTASVDLTVEYDHTGGAYERLLTATDGTFPADAQYGYIRVGTATYRISHLISDTAAILEVDFSPPSDFTDDVQWSRSSYIFPREFSKVHQVHNTTNNMPMACVSTQELMAGSYNGWGLGSATHFSFQNRGGYFGATEFVILPTPLTSETIEVTATVSPLIPKINEISGSGASVVNTSYEVTVPGASFDERCIGCIFRLGLDATPPINLDSANWSFQAFIISVTSSSVLVLSEAAPEDATRGYCISSPIDAEASTMLEYIEDEAYHQYTKNHDHKSFMTARGVAADSLRAAICRDNKISMNGYAMSGGGYLAGGYPVFPDE